MNRIGKTVILYRRGDKRSLMLVNLDQWPAEPVVQVESVRFTNGADNETSGICANGLFDRNYLTYRVSIWHR